MARWKKPDLAEHLKLDHELELFGCPMPDLQRAHRDAHNGKPHPPAEPARRPIAGWVMLPVRVVVDVDSDGKPRVMQADIYYDYARPAVDDFGDGVGFESCRRMEDLERVRYEGIGDEKDAEAMGVPWKWVDADEKRWWEETALYDLERHLEDQWEDEVDWG